MILGHSHFSTTMQIYTHVDEESRREDLSGLNDLLARVGATTTPTVVRNSGQALIQDLSHASDLRRDGGI
jgi:hypothetical protein